MKPVTNKKKGNIDMEKIKVTSSETKIVNEIFATERYFIWYPVEQYDADYRHIISYRPKILEIHDSKEDAINAIKNHKYYNDVYISSSTQFLKSQYVKPVSDDEK